MALSGTLKHPFWTALGSSERLDTTIDAENEFEWYKKKGGWWSPVHWKQKAQLKKVKNVKGEKGISGCAQILAAEKNTKNWDLGNREQVKQA